MTLIIFDGNIKNYTVLNKSDDVDKIELIKVQDENNESTITKKTYNRKAASSEGIKKIKS